jgi:hypothetical protein
MTIQLNLIALYEPLPWRPNLCSSDHCGTFCKWSHRTASASANVIVGHTLELRSGVLFVDGPA